MRFCTPYRHLLLVALLLHAVGATATDFDDPACRAFIAQAPGASRFVAEAKATRVFGPVDTPEKEQELSKRFQQYNWVRTRFYNLQSDLKFFADLELSRQHMHRIATEHTHTENELSDRREAAEQADRYLLAVVSSLREEFPGVIEARCRRFFGVGMPTVAQLQEGTVNASVLLGLSQLRKSFFKVLMRNVPLDRSWNEIPPEQSSRYYDLALAVVLSENPFAGESLITVGPDRFPDFEGRLAALMENPRVPEIYKEELKDHAVFLRTYSLPLDQQLHVVIQSLEELYQ